MAVPGKAARLRAGPRCGARTRAGAPCRAPAVKGKRRCRMHGGANGAGAPKGNRNRLVHGRRSAAAEADRRRLRELMRASRRLLAEIG
ncbi:MAG: HGGxSTG domain-containing protein [Dongiaceae bacterium]